MTCGFQFDPIIECSELAVREVELSFSAMLVSVRVKANFI